jgi:hypothetical protein
LFEGAAATDEAWAHIGSTTTAGFGLVTEAARNMVEGVQGELSHFFRDVLTGEMDSFADYLRGFAGMLAGILSDIASMFIMRGFGGLLGMGGNGIDTGLFGWQAAFMHSGGTVGQDGTRRSVDPSVFVGAPHYHQGGTAGLKSDEVPAILQRGETIIPRGGKAGGGGGVRIVNVLDPGLIGKWAASADGERVLINLISRNSMVLRRAMG